MPGNGIRETGVGRLSPALRKVVKQLETDADNLRDAIVAALAAGIVDYSAMAHRDTRSDVEASVGRNVAIWYTALLSGRPPDQDTLEDLAEFGRHRVHQGVSLPGLLQAYRIGSRVIWETLLDAVGEDVDLQQELLLKVSPYILFHFDLLGHTIGQAYSNETQQLARWRDRLRHELGGVIFSQTADLASFREHTLALKLDGNAPHVALALGLTAAKSPPRRHERGMVERLLQAIAETVELLPEQFLHLERHDHLLAWVPLVTGEPAIRGERRLADAAESLHRKHGLICGVGLPNAGPAGWKCSAEQALRAIAMGRRLDPAAGAFRYTDICLADAVMADDGTARFLQGLLERLAVEPHLLDTLQAYFDRRGFRKGIAADLHIHPNTLSYRLERIQSALHIDLDDPQWQATLHTALRLRRLNASGA